MVDIPQVLLLLVRVCSPHLLLDELDLLSRSVLAWYSGHLEGLGRHCAEVVDLPDPHVTAGLGLRLEGSKHSGVGRVSSS